MLSKEDFENKRQAVELQNVLLGNIATQLGTFHGLSNDNDATYQGRLKALRTLDRLLAQWFDTFVKYKISETTNGTLLRQVLQESEEAHRTIIAEVQKNANLLPVDTSGMEVEDQEALLLLWRSIVEGKGNIRIKERQKGFGDRMLAAIAKILQGPQGRALIAQLNAGGEEEARQVILSSNFQEELAKSKVEEKDQSEAIPINSIAKETKDYEPKVVSQEELTKVSKEDIAEFKGDESDMALLRGFLTTLKKPYFKYQGRVYKPGTKTGSLVRISGQGGIKTLVGERDQEIVTPEFVTVAHELGHVQEFLAGAATSGFDLSEFGVKANTPSARLWRLSAEYANIRGSENVIRGEHGLSARQYHAGDVADVRKQVRFNAFEDAKFDLYDKATEWTQTVLVTLRWNSLWNELSEFEVQPPKDFDFTDDGQYNGLMKKVKTMSQIVQALDTLASDPKNPDVLYEKAKGRLKSNLDRDNDWSHYYLLFKKRIQLPDAAVIVKNMDVIMQEAYSRYLSMEFKTARDVEFLGLDENE